MKLTIIKPISIALDPWKVSHLKVGDIVDVANKEIISLLIDNRYASTPEDQEENVETVKVRKPRKL